MSDTIDKEDCSSREINSEDKIAALKERLAIDRSGITVNGANGNGIHNKMSEKNSKDLQQSKISNGVKPDEDNRIKPNSSEKLNNSSTELQHTNGNSTKNTVPFKTKQMLVDANRKTQIATGISVASSGNEH